MIKSMNGKFSPYNSIPNLSVTNACHSTSTAVDNVTLSTNHGDEQSKNALGEGLYVVC